jgi:hypothetical protein
MVFFLLLIPNPRRPASVGIDFPLQMNSSGRVGNKAGREALKDKGMLQKRMTRETSQSKRWAAFAFAIAMLAASHPWARIG